MTGETAVQDKAIRVLLVDDNEDQAFIAIEALSDDPRITVTDVNSGPACLECLDKKTYDLVILDYSMPQMTGMEVLRTMRSRGLDVPVIMVTGYGDERVAVDAMKLGAADYIIKSGHYHELLPSICTSYDPAAAPPNRIGRPADSQYPIVRRPGNGCYG